MKNYTPLVKITSRNVNVMIYRYKSWYKVNDVEFTLPRDLSLADFFKKLDFFSSFDKTRYKQETPEAKKAIKKCEKLQKPAKELFEKFGLTDFSQWCLYKQTLNII